MEAAIMGKGGRAPSSVADQQAPTGTALFTAAYTQAGAQRARAAAADDGASSVGGAQCPLNTYKCMVLAVFLLFDCALGAGYSLQSHGGNSGSGGGLGTDGRLVRLTDVLWS